MNERLYRSVDDRVIAGVCGGLADRLALDPSLVRVAWAVLALVTGIFPLLVVYVIMAAVVPEDPKGFAGAGPPPPRPAAPLGPSRHPGRQKRPAEPDGADPGGRSRGSGSPRRAPARPVPRPHRHPGARSRRRRAGRESGERATLSSASSVGSAWWRSGSTSSSATGSRSTGASSGRPASCRSGAS